MGRIAATALALAGCGRIGFDAVDSDATSDVATDPYRDLIVADGPIAYWRLGETAGTVAVDEMGNTDGVYEGACQHGAAGAVAGNSAVRFPQGAPQCMVTFGTAFELIGRAPFTIEAWIAPSALPFGHVFSRQIRDGIGPLEGYAFLTSPPGLYAERIVSSSNSATMALPITLDTFEHVAMVYDGNQITLHYGTATTTPRTDATSATPFDATAMIGCATFEINCYEGVIDEVAIYDRALSPATLAAHRDARTP